MSQIINIIPIVSSSDTEVVWIFVIVVVVFASTQHLFNKMNTLDWSAVLDTADSAKDLQNYTLDFQDKIPEIGAKKRSLLMKVIAVVWSLLLVATPLYEAIPQLKGETYYYSMCCICL